MDRRNFLKAVALTGAAVTTIKDADAMSVLTQSFQTTNAAAKYDMVAVLGGEPEAMFRKAIAEMGGIKRFINKGDRVCVKPNIGWDKTPELAANTNPKLVQEIIKQCFDAGAQEVTVFDHTCDDWRKCYTNSGIEAAAKAAGAKVVPAHQESYYKSVSLPKGRSLKEAKQCTHSKKSRRCAIDHLHEELHGNCMGQGIFPRQRLAAMHCRCMHLCKTSCPECC